MRKFNIYRRKDGRWEGRISKAAKNGGKRGFHYFLGHSREAVCERMEHFLREHTNGDCPVLLEDFFTEWIASVQLRIKESTRANYLLKWSKHISPAFGDRKVSSIKASDIYSFIAEKQKRGLSDRYISDIIVLMKSVFKCAAKIYRIENPTDGIVMPKRKLPEITVLGDRQEELKLYLSRHQSASSLGVSLAITTGIRIGELCALQWSDIDLEKRVLTVRKTLQRIQKTNHVHKTKLIITEPKSESSKRCIPIPECILGLLHKFKGIDEEYVCSGKTKPVEPRTMQYRFAKILKNANLPSVHFHALRHMFASECVKLGFDIKALSEILGHSNVKITLEKYVHSDFSIKQEYMKRIQLC